MRALRISLSLFLTAPRMVLPQDPSTNANPGAGLDGPQPAAASALDRERSSGGGALAVKLDMSWRVVLLRYLRQNKRVLEY